MKPMLIFAAAVLLVLALVLTGAARAQGKLLDHDSSGVVALFAFERPAIPPAQLGLWAGRVVTATYGRTEARYGWLHQGAWRWDASGTIAVTPFRDYAVWPSDATARALIARLHELEIAETVSWDAVNGFVPPVGDVGLAVPRYEFVLWYADGALRHVYIGQTVADGSVYALLFDTFDVGDPGNANAYHPRGLFRLTAGL